MATTTNYIAETKTEKGVIYCTTDDGKCIKINLNEGVIYGVSGRPIKSCPPLRMYVKDSRVTNNPIFKALGSYYSCDKYHHIDTSFGLNLLKYIDRLVNMGIEAKRVREILSHYNAYHDRNCLLSENKTYKEITKILTSIDKNDKVTRYSDALYNYEKNEFFQKHKNSLEGLTEKQKNLVYEKMQNTPKYIPQFCSWLRYDFWEILSRQINWDYYGKNFWTGLNNYFSFCEEYNIEVPKRGIYNHLASTFITYLSVKDEAQNKILKQKVLEYKEKFFFENELFTMIFPETVQEFIDEGEALNHCLGWNGYAEKVINNRCIIALIRLKNDINRHFYTCEIEHFYDTYRIIQFRGQNNRGYEENQELSNYVAKLKEFLANVS